MHTDENPFLSPNPCPEAKKSMVNTHFLDMMTNVPPKEGLLKVGTDIMSKVHGKGRIVGYNTCDQVLYHFDRYPYTCRFENGHTEVFNDKEFQVEEKK